MGVNTRDVRHIICCALTHDGGQWGIACRMFHYGLQNQLRHSARRTASVIAISSSRKRSSSASALRSDERAPHSLSKWNNPANLCGMFLFVRRKCVMKGDNGVFIGAESDMFEQY